MAETNIYALTVPGMYGKKNYVGVRNKLLLGSFGTLSGCYYLFIYPYDLKKHRSICIIFSLQNHIRILHFPICVIKKLVSKYFIRNGSALV